jgi:cell division protein FtsL
MKKISLWVLILVFTASVAFAQNTATQQQLDKLSGQIEDLTGTVETQRKHIEALEKEIGELNDKVNTPQVNDSASREDLKRLAGQVQEVDQKRQDDRELILKEIEKLGKAAAIAPVPPPRKTTSTPKPPPDDTTAAVPQNGYEYQIKDGDNLGLIIKAYQAKGVKVTKRQIIAANPKMNPDVLIPGKKIFIPDANAK